MLVHDLKKIMYTSLVTFTKGNAGNDDEKRCFPKQILSKKKFVHDVHVFFESFTKVKI